MLRRFTPPFDAIRSPRPTTARPLGLSGDQLARVMDACAPLAPEKRVLALERIAARLTLQGAFGDSDVDRAIAVAFTGLIHEPTA
jgi:hypothetical protein